MCNQPGTRYVTQRLAHEHLRLDTRLGHGKAERRAKAALRFDQKLPEG